MGGVQFDQLNRYVAGELSAPEQRKLGQAALDNPELFEALAAAAVADDVLRRRQQSTAVPARKVRPRTRDDEATKGGWWGSRVHPASEGTTRTLAVAGLATAATSIVPPGPSAASPSPTRFTTSGTVSRRDQ